MGRNVWRFLVMLSLGSKGRREDTGDRVQEKWTFTRKFDKCLFFFVLWSCRWRQEFPQKIPHQKLWTCTPALYNISIRRAYYLNKFFKDLMIFRIWNNASVCITYIVPSGKVRYPCQRLLFTKKCTSYCLKNNIKIYIKTGIDLRSLRFFYRGIRQFHVPWGRLSL
jgi:hypothetical protein